VAYFLPGVEKKGKSGKLSADLPLDVCIIELKTVTNSG
jgi:hypothetical protein